MKDIEDEIPCEVPEGWAWCRLPNICREKITDGTHNSPSNERKGDFLYITAKNIKFSGVDLTDVSYVSKEIHDVIYNRCSPVKNDVLLTKDGTIGEATVNNLDYPFSLLSSVALIKTANSILPWYIVYVLKSDYLQKKMIKEAKGTALKRIILDQINSFLVPLPPLNEQKEIISQVKKNLTLIDSIDNDKSDLQTAIKQTKSKILDLAIHGKLVPQDSSDEPASVLLERLRAEKEAKIKAGELKRNKNDSYIYKSTTDNCYYEKFNGKEAVCIDDEIPFEIPNSWQWCKLNELGETNIGLTYHPTDLVNTGIPVLRSNNIQNDSLCLDDLARVQTKILENQFVSDGDILICARNGSQALVGKCTIIDKLPEKMAFGAFMAIFRSKYNKYIIRYLQSFYFKDYLRESNSTQIYQLTQSMLKNALIPLPPISEQKRIATKIEEMFNLLDQIQSNLV